mmetsp:Transcript_21058/g.53554  ORF Transcript_21058/g.53554 Transcript_21058/m.53554 type:complete len:113 (+) Transcript_21058:177-515(+)
MSVARPTYIRGGSINSRTSFLDDLLALPFRVYAFLVMFVQTLINPEALKKGSSAGRGRGPASGFGSINSGGGGGGGKPGGGGGGGGRPGGGGSNIRGMGTLKGSSGMPPVGG